MIWAPASRGRVQKARGGSLAFRDLGSELRLHLRSGALAAEMRLTLFWSFFLAACARLHVCDGQRSSRFDKAAGISRLSRGSASERWEPNIFVILMILAILSHLD